MQEQALEQAQVPVRVRLCRWWGSLVESTLPPHEATGVKHLWRMVAGAKIEVNSSAQPRTSFRSCPSGAGNASNSVKLVSPRQ